MATNIPKKIGKYDVLDVIGRGGMGIVYRAKDPFLDRMVAIKIMTISYADYPDLLQRFYREAKATANLQHPNIVTVFELGEHEGSPYLAMQYLEGASLETILRSGQSLSLLQKIDIIIQSCHGLAYAHQRGIVHRDIKPGNIMVLKDESVKIVDFGIARIGDTNFTRTGQFMGSLNYMSLEQLNEKLQVDQRTDVYSTGVVLYQILTGALPFEADSTGATLMKILNEPPPPFSKYLSSFPPEIETITMKALAKDRDQRYSSADELALDLSQLQARLKQEFISVHMQQAERLLQQNNLIQANDELVEVLKLDKQHTRASALLRALRKQIEKEQSVERVRQLRQLAEEAFRREEFDPALGYLEQAISLDSTNVDLQQLRTKVQGAKAEIEHLRQVMQRAENAHRAGSLDTAKQAIEEVLARRPNDTRVKSLYRMIQKELDDRLRQKRLENMLEAARKEMANRHYTAAFDILKEAEKIDPDAPALRSMLETFTSAREQEQRRRALEQVTHQVEQALNTDDHQSALDLLAEGLKRFPGEPALIKFRDLADSQRLAAQTKTYVRERIAAAREILNAGNAAGAIRVLQDALKKVPSNPHLESLVSIAQERMVQDRDEQAKAHCVQQANDALGRRAYDEAIQFLEAGQVRFAASPEIDNLLRFAREQRAKEAKHQVVENSVRRAQEFLRNQEYDKAISLLESILARTPDEELGVLLEEARRRRSDFNRQIVAAIARGRQFLNEGSPAKAIEFLQAQPTALRKSEQFHELLLAAASQNRTPAPAAPVASEPEFDAPQPQKTMMWDTMAPPEVEPLESPRIPGEREIVPPPVEPSDKPQSFLRRFSKQQKLLAAAAVGLVLLVLVVVVFWPSTPVGTLVVNSGTDGATVIVDHQPPRTIHSGQPLRIPLEAGPHHSIVIQKDGYKTYSNDAVDVVKDRESPLSIDLPEIVVATGTLLIQTNVADVDVFADNDPKKITDGKELKLTLSVGPLHQVRVEKNGYDQPDPQQVRIQADTKNPPLQFTLNRTTGPPTILAIQKSKPGAAVVVDGYFRGKIQPDGTLPVPVKPGERKVEVRLEDYEPFGPKTVTVEQGKTLQIEAPLTANPVVPKSAADIVFEADHDTVATGGTVRLSWKINHATAAQIDQNIGSIDSLSSGYRDVKVPADTTYTLTATGEDGKPYTKDKRVSVALKPIATITATPSTITEGDSSTLEWHAQYAEEVTESPTPGAGLNGTATVTPGKTTIYHFAAKGLGGTGNASVTVNVQPKVQPPPQPLTPTTDPREEEVKAAIQDLSDAYATADINNVLKVFPHMSKSAQDNLKHTYNLVHYFKPKYACDPTVFNGDIATVACTKTVSATMIGKKSEDHKPEKVTISLRQVSPHKWQIENEVSRGQ